MIAEMSCLHSDESLPEVSNGSLEINGQMQPKGSYQPGSVAVYTCFPGYKLLPLSAGKKVCRRGKWEGKAPACGE